jgi:anti-sigma factor RsiW
MTCRDGVGLLADYVEGLIPAERRRVVEGHVAGCRRCRGFVASYLATPRLWRAATEVRMPRRLASRLRRFTAGLRPR